MADIPAASIPRDSFGSMSEEELQKHAAKLIYEEREKVKLSKEVILGFLQYEGKISLPYCNGSNLINLSGTDFSEADLNEVGEDITRFDLTNCKFHGAKFDRKTLFYLLQSLANKSNLAKLNIEGINCAAFKVNSRALGITASTKDLIILIPFNFSNANLTDSNCRNGIFIGADFTNAVLENVQFNNSDLRKAKFDGANIKDADFSNAEFTPEQFENAVNVEHAKFEAHELEMILDYIYKAKEKKTKKKKFLDIAVEADKRRNQVQEEQKAKIQAAEKVMPDKDVKATTTQVLSDPFFEAVTQEARKLKEQNKI